MGSAMIKSDILYDSIVSSRDFRADQGKRYDHDVTVAHVSYIWATL